nr:hypothetical protein [Tanacetum cinerariifolium]
MDYANLTMEEYIEFEAEKARRISFDESDDEDYTFIYDKISFSCKLIPVDNLKTDSENDNLKVNVSSGDIVIEQSGNGMAPLPVRDHRHPWLRYDGQEYTNAIIYDYENRLGRIFGRQLGRLRHQMSWRQFILVMGLHTPEEMETDRLAFDGDFLGTVPSYTSIWDPLRRLCHRLIAFSIFGRGQATKKVTATDLFYLRSMDEETMINIPYLLAQYLFRHAEGRKQGARMQQVATSGVAQINQEVLEEGVQADLALAQAPPAAHCKVLSKMSKDFSRFTTWTIGRLSQLLDASGVTYTSYGDYQIPCQRRT